MGVLTSLLSIFVRKRRRPIRNRGDEAEWQFVPLDELDAQDSPNAELIDGVGGHVAPALMEAVPAVAVLTHAAVLVSELADGLRARPTPQAVSLAKQRYLQQRMRTRLGERPGVWVPILRPRFA